MGVGVICAWVGRVCVVACACVCVVCACVGVQVLAKEAGYFN